MGFAQHSFLIAAIIGSIFWLCFADKEIRPRLLGFFGYQRRFELNHECNDDENIRKGPIDDQRDCQEIFQPKQGCRMRYSKKAECCTDIERQMIPAFMI